MVDVESRPINISDLMGPVLDPDSDSSGGDSSSSSISLENLEISTHKLALVLGITFGFILLLLFSLICIFYVMGFLQNVFGYSWGPPTGRIISTSAFYPTDEISHLQPDHQQACHPDQNHLTQQRCTHVYGQVQRC